MMEDLSREVKRRAIRGVRWVMILNILSTPLSFLTNLALGRISPAALGYYGAIHIFVGAMSALFLLGGRQVFTRFMPGLDPGKRFSFLTSFTVLAFALVIVTTVCGILVFPDTFQWLLEKFGDPPHRIAVALSGILLVWAVCCLALFGTMEAPRASFTIKMVFPGFFLGAVLGLGPFKGQITNNPASYLWLTAMVTYGAACLVGLYNVARSREIANTIRLSWFLPEKFRSVAFYAHMSALVMFIYASLSPSLVLLWLDVEQLSRLHAAMRYVALLVLLPTMIADVVAPGLSKIVSAGMMEKALQQASTTIKTTHIVTVPASLGLILFSRELMSMFGPGFSDYHLLLKILGVSCIAGPVVYLGSGFVASFGILGSYLGASLVYVASTILISVFFISRWGLVGAAMATTIGAFIHHTATLAVLRLRVGFRISGRVWAGWFTALLAVGVSMWLAPGLPLAMLLYAGCLALFMVLGKVSIAEVKILVRRLAGRD